MIKRVAFLIILIVFFASSLIIFASCNDALDEWADKYAVSEYTSEGLKYKLTPNEKSYIVEGIDLLTTADGIKIPANYKGKPVTEIGDFAFWGRGFKLITIPNTVKTIGNGAFYDCKNLPSITIPNSVTEIGEDAFAYCESLTKVKIGKNVKTIGNGAFYECKNLPSITIPNSVTEIGANAFAGCYKLVEVINKSPYITVTKGGYSNGSVGKYALSVFNSGDIVNSKLSNDNGFVVLTDGAQKILVAYNGTETDLEIPSYITKIYQYAFYYCTSLTNVTIPDSVTTIGEYAFA